ncbi:hypothetical protein GCM10022406_25630 [Hymenobacter algoricola]|uniref:Uncharacterized protein n=1 Tax=Hymenobacter algoricola TaxID=486267 RepID=A0ABP7N9B3_9BACT
MAATKAGAPEPVWLRAPDLGDEPKPFAPEHAARLLERQQRNKTAHWLLAEAPAPPPPSDSTALPQHDPKPRSRTRTARKPR